MITQSNFKTKYFLLELWVVPGIVLVAYSFYQLAHLASYHSLSGIALLLAAFLAGYVHSLPLNWVLLKPVQQYYTFDRTTDPNLDTFAGIRKKIFELPLRRAFWIFERFIVAGAMSLFTLTFILEQDLSLTSHVWIIITFILAGLASALVIFFAYERLCVSLHNMMHKDIEHHDIDVERGRTFSISHQILILLMIQFLLSTVLFGIFPLHFISTVSSLSEFQSQYLFHVLFTFLFLAALTIIFFKSISSNFLSGMDSLRESMTKAEEGDLGTRTPIRSTDEIGLLSSRFNKTMKSLSDIFGKVKDVSDSVALVAERLSTSSVAMSEGVELQATSTDTTASSMSEMQASITEVADSINYLFDETETTSGSILEMAASIEQVAENIESLSNSVDTTSSSIEEMNASIKQVAENAIVLNRTALDLYSSIEKIIKTITEIEQWAIQSSKLSNNVTIHAEKGSSAVQQTIQGMEEIHKFFQISGEVIQNFGERSEQIGKIVNVIDDVSSQTNLLALNAAIISAQAGEHGKEFSVVADEIRNLAEKATSSTKEINHLISNVQLEALNAVKTMEEGARLVAQGVKMSHRAGDVLTLITQSSIKSAQMTSQIEEASMEQTSQSRDIAKTVDHFKMMSDQLAKATKEQKIGISQIMREAENMMNMTQLVRNATDKQGAESRSISQAVSDVKRMVERIRIATTEQKSGSQSIIDAVEVFKDITLKNVDSMVEMDKAVDTLSSQVRSLENQVSRFRV